MSTTFGLFATPVTLAERFAPEDMIAQLLKQAQAGTVANDRSDRLSHTEIIQPDAKPVTQRLARALTPNLEAFGSLLFGETLRWQVKEMWINTLHRGGRQAMHAHANSFVSGVLYLTDSDPSANLVFHKPMGGTEFVFSNLNKNARTGPYNGSRWSLPRTGAGDLLLFPSYLLHEVPENRGETRVSLAFNAIPDRLNSWGYSVRFSR